VPLDTTGYAVVVVVVVVVVVAVAVVVTSSVDLMDAGRRPLCPIHCVQNNSQSRIKLKHILINC